MKMVVVKHLSSKERNMLKQWKETIDLKKAALTRLPTGTLTRYLAAKSKKVMSFR